MKILFLCNKMPYPPNDGGAIATLNMICGLSRHDNQVDVLTMQTHKHQYDVDKIPAKYTNSISWHPVWVNTRLNIFKLAVNLLFSRKPYNAIRFESDLYQKKLVELLQNHEYDIIQLEGLYLAPYIETIKKISKAQIVLRAHNVEWKIWQRLYQNETRFLVRWYKKVLYQRIQKMELEALRKTDLLVPITHRDSEHLPFAHPEKVMVSSTGIVPEHFKENNKPTVPNSLFYIGALDWEPNREALIWFIEKVWVYLKIDFPDWNFYVAGRNAPESFINQINKLGVVYSGQVADALEFIDNYSINVVPLLSGSGIRIKIIEAMARGRCVVTTSIGAEGIEAVSGEHFWICTNEHEMQETLRQLIQQPALIETTGKLAYQYAKEYFDNYFITGKLDKFYRQWL
jgi:polysaccharide biosynthesis protein PslH